MEKIQVTASLTTKYEIEHNMTLYYIACILVLIALFTAYAVLEAKAEKAMSAEGTSTRKKYLIGLGLLLSIVLGSLIFTGYVYCSNTVIYNKVMSTINTSYKEVEELECNRFSLKGTFESENTKYEYKFSPKDNTLSVSNVNRLK